MVEETLACTIVAMHRQRRFCWVLVLYIRSIPFAALHGRDE